MSKCKEGALELLLPAKTFIERLYNKSSSNKNTWKTKFTQHEITCRYKKKKKAIRETASNLVAALMRAARNFRPPMNRRRNYYRLIPNSKSRVKKQTKFS
jgi:hypothetical protein